VLVRGVSAATGDVDVLPFGVSVNPFDSEGVSEVGIGLYAVSGNGSEVLPARDVMSEADRMPVPFCAVVSRHAMAVQYGAYTGPK